MAEEANISKAISQQMFGRDIDLSRALVFSRLEKPKSVKRGNVLVRITMRPVHPFDLIVIRNSMLLPFTSGRSFDIVPGCEGVGIIDQVGEGVESFKKGDRVIPVLMWTFLENGRGSWQEYVEVSVEKLIPVPDEMSDEDAAQFICNPWTAYGVVKDLNCSKGGFLLLNGAGSVIGRMIIKLAKHWSIKTICVVRREGLKKELQELGADVVLNNSTEDVVAGVKEVTGGAGVEGAIDMLGGPHTKIAAACVKTGGKLFNIGYLDSPDAVISINDLARQLHFSFWSLGAMKDNREIGGEVMKLFKARVFQPLSGKKFKLEDYLAAIEESEKEARGGKVLLVS